MPRSASPGNASTFQEVLRYRLAELDPPPVDLAPGEDLLDKIVIDGRQAEPRPWSWRELADRISELLNLNPKLGHATLRAWYQDRLDELGISRLGPGPGPAARPQESVEEPVEGSA